MAQVPRERILTGSILKILLTLSWPVILTQFLHITYQLADTFWLGRLGEKEGVAAIATTQIAGPVIMILVALGLGLSIAGVALVSQYVGAGQERKASECAGQVISAMVAFALIVSVIGYFVLPFIIHLFNIEESITHTATRFIRILLLGFPLEFIVFGIEAIFRSYGDTITPMKITAFTVVVNVILDPFMIYGWSVLPKMGVEGAAVATVIAYGLASILGIYAAFSRKSVVQIKLRDLIPNKQEIWRILKIGIPASIGQAVASIGIFILMYIIALVPDSTLVLASYGIAQRVNSVVHVLIWGIGAACTTMFGQALGADLIDRAKKTTRFSIVFIFFAISILASILYAFRPELISIFINDPDVIKEGAHYLSFLLVAIPFFAVSQIINAIFRGSGHNVPVMIAEFGRLVFIRLPLCYFLGISLEWGSTGMWIGMATSNIASALIGFALLATGVWKHKVIKEKPLSYSVESEFEQPYKG